MDGSNSINCDDNGVCNCKANIINDQCDACDDGFFNFPTCEGKHYLLSFIHIRISPLHFTADLKVGLLTLIHFYFVIKASMAYGLIKDFLAKCPFSLIKKMM